MFFYLNKGVPHNITGNFQCADDGCTIIGQLRILHLSRQPHKSWNLLRCYCHRQVRLQFIWNSDPWWRVMKILYIKRGIASCSHTELISHSPQVMRWCRHDVTWSKVSSDSDGDKRALRSPDKHWLSITAWTTMIRIINLRHHHASVPTHFPREVMICSLSVPADPRWSCAGCWLSCSCVWSRLMFGDEAADRFPPTDPHSQGRPGIKPWKC